MGANQKAFQPTESELATIKELYDSGISYENIGIRYGYSRQAVRKVVERNGWRRAVEKVWTDEKKAEFKRLYDEGHTHSEIAMTLGTTKDACLRLRQRMGLPERAKIKNHVPEKPVQIVQHYTAAEAEPRPEHGVLIWDLQPHHCRWPIHGDADEHMIYCGEQKEEGSSYCPEHVIASKPQSRALTDSERQAKAKMSNFYLRRLSHVGG